MEKVLENAIDNGLGRISSGLYLFSIGLGIVLVILGVILIFKNRGSKEKKKTANVGLICLLIGIVAVISGGVQL